MKKRKMVGGVVLLLAGLVACGVISDHNANERSIADATRANANNALTKANDLEDRVDDLEARIDDLEATIASHGIE